MIKTTHKKKKNDLLSPAETAEEQVRRWDAGQTIWTVDMGGMGPGYEQAIQILAVEITRDNLGKLVPTTNNEYRDWGDSAVSRLGYSCYRFSDAQIGAAKAIALLWLRDGPKQFHDSAPEGRRIQVSKFFPKAPEAA